MLLPGSGMFCTLFLLWSLQTDKFEDENDLDLAQRASNHAMLLGLGNVS